MLPPIGAQGLNLGLRDAAMIAELVVDAHRAGADVGADALTPRYDRMRRGDVAGRTVAVDLLNRSLLTDFPARAGRARARALSHGPHRAAAPRGHARRRRAGGRRSLPDAGEAPFL